MSIRPIDVQIMIHKASEVSRFNSNSSDAQAAKAGQFAQDFKKEVENQGQQVKNSHAADKAEVNKDGRSGSGYSKKRDKKDGSKDEDKDTKSDKPMFKNEQGRFSVKV